MFVPSNIAAKNAAAAAAAVRFLPFVVFAET
jgi:hypothetical protein